MSNRVLATEEAKQKCQEMQRTLEGELASTIEQLQQQGNFLSQRDQWDGQLAEQFRAQWPDMHRTLLKAKEAVEQLRANAQVVTTNILTAGGEG